MPALRRHVPFTHAEPDPGQPSSSRVVAAVLANLEDSVGVGHSELSRGDFRAQVQARGRSCDEALLELRRAALVREAGGAGTAVGDIARRPITGRRVTADDTVRIDQLEADNVRLRKLVSDQQLEIDGLRRVRRARSPTGA